MKFAKYDAFDEAAKQSEQKMRELEEYLSASSDEGAVDQFAAAMKAKLADARKKGRGGWQACDKTDLLRMLKEHVDKGDMRDVANIAMFIWWIETHVHDKT